MNTTRIKSKTQNLNCAYANLLNIIYIPMIPDFEVRSKIVKVFNRHNPFEEYSVKIYKIDPYFYEQYEKYIQVKDNERKYILFKIDIYFSECSLAVEIDKKDVDRDLIFEVKRQKALEKKLNCKFIRILIQVMT